MKAYWYDNVEVNTSQLGRIQLSKHFQVQPTSD